MEEYSLKLAEDIVFDNIEVYRKYKGGVHCAYEIKAKDGYVMYDTTANNKEMNPSTMEEISVVYYFTRFGAPVNYDFDKFAWKAVLKKDVDEKYIF